jgi:RNA polymerase sigma-70 factor (ECF subfamily)
LLNTAINGSKSAKRRPQTVPLSTDIDPYDPQDTSLEQIRQLYALIHQLDVMDRGLVLLWLEDIGYDEIAAVMGITVANVGIKLHRISAISSDSSVCRFSSSSPLFIGLGSGVGKAGESGIE